MTPRIAQFEDNRARLWRVAYRMLGSHDEADDAVQEAYLRWHRTDVESVRVPQAWLVRTITRICIDRLRQLRAERESYTGPWLPEPLVDDVPPADESAELASDLSVALLAVLERLAPEERAAFLLREVFDSGYDDIAVQLLAFRKLLGNIEFRLLTVNGEPGVAAVTGAASFVFGIVIRLLTLGVTGASYLPCPLVGQTRALKW